MRKLQQFYVMKFNSGTLHNSNYHITREDIKTARAKQEIVSLADSQCLRTIREIRYQKQTNPTPFSQETLNSLLSLKKSLLKREPKTPQEKATLKNQINLTTKKINQLLYIPEYVLIKIEDKKHYRNLIKKTLTITQIDPITDTRQSIRYVRLLCGAGMARNNTVAFIREDYETQLKTLLRNGARDTKITPNKYNAYFALSSTATHILSTPKCCLIDDCEINMTKRINWCQPTLNKETIVKCDKELPFNFFDGGGLIDITKATQWAEELQLDYIPSVFIVRNIFVKGCLFTVDFKKFATEVAHQTTITDLYNNPQDILSCDIILSKSQFKLWNAYDSMEHYQEQCDLNHNYWGISRVSPKHDDNYFTTNYQFLQVLDLTPEDIVSLCEPTVSWLTGVSGLNRNYALLYLLGSLCNKDLTPEEIYASTSDPIAKALILNPELMQEQHIRQSIIQSINKKIKEAYIGKLIVRGCFNTMIPDPYAMMEWAFSNNDVSKVHGLLSEFEHYSHYWNVRNASEAVGMRSPLTWRSEVNPLVFRNTPEMQEWYKYLQSGTIYNIWGCDCMLHADSDFDGDIVAQTDNPTFIKCRFKDEDNILPITYQKNTVPKSYIKEKDLYKADIDSFDTTIGQVTNRSTSFYDLLYKFKGKEDPYSKQCYDEIIERLKLIRKQQGNAIDAAKGVKVDPFPSIWIKPQKIKCDDDPDTIVSKTFLNDTCGDRKPYFFRYRYPVCNTEYKEYIEAKKAYCYNHFGESLETILTNHANNQYTTKIPQSNKSEGFNYSAQDVNQFVENYYKYIPLINYHSPMNQICNYLENKLAPIKSSATQKTPECLIPYLQTMSPTLTPEIISKLSGWWKSYSNKKKELKNQQKTILKPLISNSPEDHIVNINQYAKEIRAEAEEYFSTLIPANSNLSETIANYVVEYAYNTFSTKDKSVVWGVFGKYLLSNIAKTSPVQPSIPILNPQGDIEYLGANYKEYYFTLEEDKNDNF